MDSEDKDWHDYLARTDIDKVARRAAPGNNPCGAPARAPSASAPAATAASLPPDSDPPATPPPANGGSDAGKTVAPP